jgi:hypothetical protein
MVLMERKLSKKTKKSIIIGLIWSLGMPLAVGAYYKIDKVDVAEGINCQRDCTPKNYTVYIARDTNQGDKVVSVSKPVYNANVVTRDDTYYDPNTNTYYPNNYSNVSYQNNYPVNYQPAYQAGYQTYPQQYYYDNGYYQQPYQAPAPLYYDNTYNNSGSNYLPEKYYYNPGAHFPSVRPHGPPAW